MTRRSSRHNAGPEDAPAGRSPSRAGRRVGVTGGVGAGVLAALSGAAAAWLLTGDPSRGGFVDGTNHGRGPALAEAVGGAGIAAVSLAACLFFGWSVVRQGRSRGWFVVLALWLAGAAVAAISLKVFLDDQTSRIGRGVAGSLAVVVGGFGLVAGTVLAASLVAREKLRAVDQEIDT